jgi:hypothetical protein
MSDTDLRLDGNAAGGVLAEVFGADVTAALSTCAGCGNTAAVGAVHVYAQAPGTVLRCPRCEAILMCIVRLGDRILFDMTGTRSLELEAAG